MSPSVGDSASDEQVVHLAIGKMRENNNAFPMTVKAFFDDADRYLNRGDILLSRSPFLASRLIRWSSRSFFSHAAIVFLLPQDKEYFSNTFVIESLFKGVGIANLETYVSGRNPVEVGILRLEGQGFNQDFFKRSNGVLLNEVNRPYDFHRLWRMALVALFGFQLAIRRMQRRPNVYRRWFPRQFICSGFIQYGFYQAALFSNIATRCVILKNGLVDPSPDEMMGITPEDLATSDRLTWKYVIRRGWVYEAENYAAAKRIISGA